MYKNRILSSIFFDAIPIPILYQMLDSVDARCRFRLIVPSLLKMSYNTIFYSFFMPKCRINLYDICHTLELGSDN